MWNVMSMNQGKLDMVKQEMVRININTLGISELTWTGMAPFNSGDQGIRIISLVVSNADKLLCSPWEESITIILPLSSITFEYLKKILQLVFHSVNYGILGNILKSIPNWSDLLFDLYNLIPHFWGYLEIK